MLDDEMCNWTWLHTVMSNITVFNIPIYLRHRISFSLQNQKQRIKRAKLNNVFKGVFFQTEKPNHMVLQRTNK